MKKKTKFRKVIKFSPNLEFKKKTQNKVKNLEKSKLSKKMDYKFDYRTKLEKKKKQKKKKKGLLRLYFISPITMELIPIDIY